jgi:hypothetical protein
LSFLFASCVAALPARAISLVGVEATSGSLHRVSAADASLALIGSTGLPLAGDPANRLVAALERAPNGTLYAFTTGDDPMLYEIDDATGAATAIGALGLGFVSEGALAFAPNGTAYGVTHFDGDQGERWLFTLDLTTGAATRVATFETFEPSDEIDVNGLAWRSDGMLVGHERVSNSLLVIDPATAAYSILAALSPTVGAVGGMTAWKGVGYLATSGPGSPTAPGSDELWRFDLFTGAATRIGSLGTTGLGISGLAVPEPECGALLALGALVLSRRRAHAAT